MVNLRDLTQRILRRHIASNTGYLEAILLGYCSNETAGEHISRYLFVAKISHGIVLDCGAGSCYGSSILRRINTVEVVISVDIDEDLLRYGKLVYNADSLCADAAYLPFREMTFDSIVSIETLEHIKDGRALLNNIKYCLKGEGSLILSTPNKLYTSPFLRKPLNPYHKKEYYLGPLLNLLESSGFQIRNIYGGKKMTSSELLRSMLFSAVFFLRCEFSIKLPYKVYCWILNLTSQNRREKVKLLDPVPELFPHLTLKLNSNITPYQYFVIHANVRKKEHHD